jgi:hypothetical protein
MIYQSIIFIWYTSVLMHLQPEHLSPYAEWASKQSPKSYLQLQEVCLHLLRKMFWYHSFSSGGIVNHSQKSTELSLRTDPSLQIPCKADTPFQTVSHSHTQHLCRGAFISPSSQLGWNCYMRHSVFQSGVNCLAWRLNRVGTKQGSGRHLQWHNLWRSHGVCIAIQSDCISHVKKGWQIDPT